MKKGLFIVVLVLNAAALLCNIMAIILGSVGMSALSSRQIR